MNEAVIQSKLIDKTEIMNYLINIMKKEVVSYVNEICKDLFNKLNGFELTTNNCP